MELSRWNAAALQAHANAEKLLQCNRITEPFGLALTIAQALELAQQLITTLQDTKRIEFGEGILPKLIYAFCNSPYLASNHYCEILSELQACFYYFKNETYEQMSDDDLVDFMAKHFNGDCQGSVEYLRETVLETYSKEMRLRAFGMQTEQEEDADD